MGRGCWRRYDPPAPSRISAHGWSERTSCSTPTLASPDRPARSVPMSGTDPQRTDDEIVNLLSQWLMRSLGNDELRKRIEAIGTAELAPGQRLAVDELLVALANAFPGERGDLEMIVREALESLAYGE